MGILDLFRGNFGKAQKADLVQMQWDANIAGWRELFRWRAIEIIMIIAITGAVFLALMLMAGSMLESNNPYFDLNFSIVAAISCLVGFFSVYLYKKHIRHDRMTI